MRPNQIAAAVQAPSASSASSPDSPASGTPARATAVHGRPMMCNRKRNGPNERGPRPVCTSVRGTTYIISSRRLSTSRTRRRESIRSRRLRTPEASARLKTMKISAASRIRGATAQPPTYWLSIRPAVPPISSSTISAPVVRRSKISTKYSRSWGIGYTSSLRMSSPPPMLAESTGINCQ